MNVEMESPGTRSNAARAGLETACHGFPGFEHGTATPITATHFRDRDANAIAPIRELRRAWA